MNSTYHFYVGSGMYYGGNINIFAHAYVDVLTLMLDKYTYLYIDIHITYMSISIYIYIGLCFNLLRYGSRLYEFYIPFLRRI